MRPHARSGAGIDKGDMSDKEQVVEIKDANRSYKLSLDDVRKHWTIGVRTGKEPVMWIFMDGGKWLLKCTIERTDVP